MIGRKATPQEEAIPEESSLQGFDTFDLRLGDVMRGERATMGKSLLDVQRELRIKASYIAAIENCDPSAFETPGFIAGYVRSYARYLGMDPDQAFAIFCEESGFAVAHGMSAEASSRRKAPKGVPPKVKGTRDPIAEPNTPFAPGRESFFAHVEPHALGSLLVVVMLIAALGVGGWTILREVQRVQLAPVDQTPDVLADLDPLSAARRNLPAGNDVAEGPDVFTPEANEALDRLYRPQTLDVPVVVARDAPISSLDPATLGSYAEVRLPDTSSAAPLPTALASAAEPAPLPQVSPALGPGVTIMAVRPAWVQVKSADGTVLLSKVMDGGETFAVPQGDTAARIRIGESGAVYFAIDGQTYGPAGSKGAVTRNLALDAGTLTESYGIADMARDTDLAQMVAELTLPAGGN